MLSVLKDCQILLAARAAGLERNMHTVKQSWISA